LCPRREGGAVSEPVDRDPFPESCLVSGPKDRIVQVLEYWSRRLCQVLKAEPSVFSRNGCVVIEP
jgi:hypothetical protein